MSGVLPDLLRPDLRLFCGTAAGTVSARARAYHAGPGNDIGPWQDLADACLDEEG